MFLILIVLYLLFIYIFNLLTKGECISAKCLIGKTAIVTGGNSGIGYQTVLNLASRGCRIIIADVVNAEDTTKKLIRQTGNNSIFYKYLDLSSIDSVRKFCRDILDNEERLDILINNAGTGGFNGQFTSDGLLKLMQINYYGHFLLTHLLVGLLRKTSNSNVVFVSSLANFCYQLSRATDINAPAKRSWLIPKIWFDYGNSKICVLIASNIFAKKLRRYGIVVNAIHPGIARTSLLQNFLKNSKNTIWSKCHTFMWETIIWIFGKSAREASQISLNCALSDEIGFGGFYVDSINFYQPLITKNSNLCDEIWKLSEELVQLTPEEKI